MLRRGSTVAAFSILAGRPRARRSRARSGSGRMTHAATRPAVLTHDGPRRERRDHAGDEAHDRDAERACTRCACPARRCRAMRARAGEDRVVVHHDVHPCAANACVDRGREGRRARTRCAARRRFTSKYVSRRASGSARKRTSTSGCSVEKQRTPAARISASTGYGNAAHGRRAAIDSITGIAESLPRRRERDEVARGVRVGDARGAAQRHRHLGAFDDARERVRVAVLGRARRSTDAPGGRASRARGARRGAPRRARSCARSCEPALQRQLAVDRDGFEVPCLGRVRAIGQFDSDVEQLLADGRHAEAGLERPTLPSGEMMMD